MSDAHAGVRQAERGNMSRDNAMVNITTAGHHRSVIDHAPIRCILEMTEESSIHVIVHPGCSVPDVHDMLRQLTLCGGQFEHVTIVAEDRDLT
jgi:hypothetical protein